MKMNKIAAAAVSGARTLGNLESNSVSRSGKISGNAGILGDYQPFIVILTLLINL